MELHYAKRELVRNIMVACSAAHESGEDSTYYKNVMLTGETPWPAVLDRRGRTKG